MMLFVLLLGDASTQCDPPLPIRVHFCRLLVSLIQCRARALFNRVTNSAPLQTQSLSFFFFLQSYPSLMSWDWSVMTPRKRFCLPATGCQSQWGVGWGGGGRWGGGWGIGEWGICIGREFLKGDITVNRVLNKQCPHHSVDRGGGGFLAPHSSSPFPLLLASCPNLANTPWQGERWGKRRGEEMHTWSCSTSPLPD